MKNKETKNKNGKDNKNQHIDFKNGELFLREYLKNLYDENKISYDLCNLLTNYVLTYDPEKRLNFAQIYKHRWFHDIHHL